MSNEFNPEISDEELDAAAEEYMVRRDLRQKK